MYKTRAWQIWWENDPDVSKIQRQSKTLTFCGVNIAELTREAFLAGVAMRPYIKGEPKKKVEKVGSAKTSIALLKLFNQSMSEQLRGKQEK